MFVCVCESVRVVNGLCVRGELANFVGRDAVSLIECIMVKDELESILPKMSFANVMECKDHLSINCEVCPDLCGISRICAGYEGLANLVGRACRRSDRQCEFSRSG